MDRAIESGLVAEDFGRPQARVVYTAMRSMQEEGAHIDAASVVDELLRTGQLDAAGGAAAVSALEALVPGEGGIEAYAARVREAGSFRRLVEAAHLIADAARGRDQTAAEILALAQDVFSALNERDIGSSAQVVNRLETVMSVVKDAIEGLRPAGQMSTGFRDLDGLLDGLFPGHLVICGARPAMGKTSFATAVAGHAADAGAHVMLFSLEMPGRDLVKREIQDASLVSLRPGRPLGRDDGHKVLEAADKVRKRESLQILDRQGLTASEICSIVRRAHRKRPVDLVIVDHMGKVKPSERYRGSKTHELGEVSEALRALAVTLDTRVFALSQLNRAVESRNDKRPTLSDLRESGDLEQDASVVMFLHRPEYYLREKTPEDRQRVCEVIVAKNRNGPTGVVDLGFEESATAFRNILRG